MHEIAALVLPQPRCLSMQIMEDGTLVALEEREVDGEHQKGRIVQVLC